MSAGGVRSLAKLVITQLAPVCPVCLPGVRVNETRGTEALLACQLLHVLGVGLPGPGESVGLGVRHLDLHHVHTVASPMCVCAKEQTTR